MPDNPTPVNISDLPVALSANGVNLVGDDNGTTKQVPVTLFSIPDPSSSTPEMDGPAAAGSSDDYARADHVHPSDTSRVPTSRTINGKALSADIVLNAVGSITLSLSWSGSDPYTQTVTVTGATVTSNSLISLQPTAAQLASLIADGVVALTVENNAGTLTAYALGAAPSTAMTIQCTLMEVDDNI